MRRHSLLLAFLLLLASLLLLSCDELDSDSSTETPPNYVENNTGPKKRSLSGSRIKFNEYKFPDGAVYYDNTPFDTKYNRTCSVPRSQEYKDFEGCCISYAAYASKTNLIFYSDPDCSTPLDILYANTVQNGDIILLSELDMCSNITYNFGIINNIIPSNDLYYGSSNYCRPVIDSYSCYSFFTYKELTTEEARALFVCVE